MSFGDTIVRSRTSGDARIVRFAMGIVLLWVIAGVKSCDEVRYSMSGQTTQANIIKVTPNPQFGVDPDHRYTFTYQWDDTLTNKPRKATFEARPRDFADGAVPAQVQIIYLPGKSGSSMPLARRSWFWPVIFVGSTALAIGAFVLLGRSLTR